MLTYIKYGSGPLVWLAFHGIGQDAQCFEPFAAPMATTHTLYSIELPFHGKSQTANWPPIITRAYWQSLLEAFITTHGLDRFSVMGFSMGGRFALLTAGLFASRLDSLWLMAPDGITEDPWFRLGTSTGAGRLLLRFFLRNAPLLLSMGRGLVYLGVLSAPLLRFIKAVLQTPGQRQQLYRAWTGFRNLTVDLPLLARELAAYQVPVRVFLGQYDAVLRPSTVQPIVALLPDCEVVILPTGHTSLVRRVAAQQQTG